ncbi:MAG: hypothetical protein KKH98_12635 [Spirochaetes bacterium]|nr:hypothetical protein [Spirochaetota bacterium]
MKKNKFICVLALFVFCALFIYAACETDKSGDDPGTPTSPTPPTVPTVLNLSYFFTGAVITTNDPLVIHIYQNMEDITNQNSPFFVHSTIDTNNSLSFPNIPAGTYYVLIWRDNPPLGTLDDCERYLIWTNFGWNSGQPVNATPITVPAGTTINVDVNVNFSDLKWWGPCT